jgi:hypothetical protein
MLKKLLILQVSKSKESDGKDEEDVQIQQEVSEYDEIANFIGISTLK